MNLRLPVPARLALLALVLLAAVLACDSDDPTTPKPPGIVDLNGDGYDDRDMQFLLDLLASNPDVDIEPTQLGYQEWEDGRLIVLNTWGLPGAPGTHVTGLTGTLPGSIGFLTHARVIDIVEQDFHGPIPRTVGNLQNVETLALAGCGLSGPIPEELSTLPLLEDLVLAVNQLSGEIPASIATKPLSLLNLSHNELTGVIPGFNFSTLHHLMLNDNQLTGEPLAQIVRAPNLRHLDLARNQFTGTFPLALLDASPWQINIDLAGNQFSGTLPAGVCDWSKFRWDDRFPPYYSRLGGNSFCPPFPECFEAWQIGEQNCTASN